MATMNEATHTTEESAAWADLPRLLMFRTVILRAAHKADLPQALIAAIVSRETGGRPEYAVPGPGGCLGDHGHGHGPMQIDDRYHQKFCLRWRTGSATLEDGMSEGCKILKANIADLKDLLPESLVMFGAIAAYNCGANRVRNLYHGLVDRWLPQPVAADKAMPILESKTTGGNYASDVLARVGWLEKNGFGIMPGTQGEMEI